MNQTTDSPQRYVVDTNTIIDLHCGNLLPFVFRLPCRFIITDFIVFELRNPPFHALSKMGLSVESLSMEEVAEISALMGRYEKPSYEDLSVLVLAKSRRTILITGDEALRHAAADNGVDCYGTCWLIDFLAESGIIPYSKAVRAYELIRKNHRFPPGDECKALLARWKSRQKMLE